MNEFETVTAAYDVWQTNGESFQVTPATASKVAT